MKKVFLSLLLAVLIWPQISWAHTLVTDGSITVVLHSYPDDDPIAGQPARILFSITDANNKFDAFNCDCQVKVSESGKTLVSDNIQQIDGASIYQFTLPLTFPHKAMYRIEVIGKPKSGGTFQNFDVSYNLNISREIATAKNKFMQWLIVTGCAILGLLSISATVWKKKI